jgi:hypothetical protein
LGHVVGRQAEVVVIEVLTEEELRDRVSEGAPFWTAVLKEVVVLFDRSSTTTGQVLIVGKASKKRRNTVSDGSCKRPAIH